MGAATGKHLKYLNCPFAQWGGQLPVGFILPPKKNYLSKI